jgi:dethiobiotin synthetase
MNVRSPQRIVVVGTGTGIGKTWLSSRLIRALRERGLHALGLKPIESGVTPLSTTDGGELARASYDDPERANALELSAPYRLPEPISPHLAARRVGIAIDLEAPLKFVREQESAGGSKRAVDVCLVETAGGLFSPLAPGLTNWDLARALEPARWLLVAPDALGVLHDVTATLHAANSLARSPDAIALCRSRPADASTGTNADEIERLGIATRPCVFPDDGPAGLSRLLSKLLE